MWSCKHHCGCSEALRWSLHLDEIAMGLCLCERVSVFVYKSLDVARNDIILYTSTLPPPLALMSSCIKTPLLEPDCSESGKNSSGTCQILALSCCHFLSCWSQEFSFALLNGLDRCVTVQVLVICSPCRLQWLGWEEMGNMYLFYGLSLLVYIA